MRFFDEHQKMHFEVFTLSVDQSSLARRRICSSGVAAQVVVSKSFVQQKRRFNVAVIYERASNEWQG